MEKKKKKMGRPSKENANTIVKSFKINIDLLEKVETYCKKNKLSFGELIRMALENYLPK